MIFHNYQKFFLTKGNNSNTQPQVKFVKFRDKVITAIPQITAQGDWYQPKCEHHTLPAGT